MSEQTWIVPIDARIAALESQLAEARNDNVEIITVYETKLAAAVRRAEEAERAVEVLRAGLEKITEHKDAGYGYYHGGDPRDFTPDSESCTPEELAAHKAACEAFDAADKAGTPMKPEPDGAGWIAPGIHVIKSNYGIGVYRYSSECAEMAADAIERARGGTDGE